MNNYSNVFSSITRTSFICNNQNVRYTRLRVPPLSVCADAIGWTGKVFTLFFWNPFSSFFNKVKNDAFHTLKTLLDTDTGTDSDSASCPVQK